MRDMTPNLDSNSPVPQYEQLYRYTAREILKGRLPGGSRLPSRRALARHLGISEQTVNSAYDLLKAEGLIRTAERKGLYVESILPLATLPEKLEKPHAQAPVAALFDFSPQSTDVRLFPHTIWAKIVREGLLDRPELLNRGDPRGEEELRAALSQFLYQFRGVVCPPERLLIASGVDQLLGVIGVLFNQHQYIAFENPGYLQAAKVLSRSGHSILPMPLDEAGLNPQALENSKATLVYLTPAHQFPTGISMPASRRAELLHWASKKPGRYIIEDDYDSEFRFSSRPLPAFQSLDGQGKVIYLSTFSRTLGPGLRIAYMALPEELSQVFRKEALRCGEGVSRFEQIAMARLLNEGHYTRHLRKANAAYQKRCSLLCSLLEKIPGAFLKGQEAGLHFLFGIQGRCEASLLLQAGEKGIPLVGLSQYTKGKTPYQTLVLGFGGLEDKHLEQAVSSLRKAWKV